MLYTDTVGSKATAKITLYHTQTLLVLYKATATTCYTQIMYTPLLDSLPEQKHYTQTLYTDVG